MLDRNVQDVLKIEQKIKIKLQNQNKIFSMLKYISSEEIKFLACKKLAAVSTKTSTYNRKLFTKKEKIAGKIFCAK